MDKQTLERLKKIEHRIGEIARAEGLSVTDIDFEIVPPQKILEGASYDFPINFSHWYYGKNYDYFRTVYEHTFSGIPYEQVWNFSRPKALVLKTAPFALQVMTIAHVYAHVDFFLNNNFCKRSREFGDIYNESRQAAERFRQYEDMYGAKEVEKLIEAAFSLRWHQHPDIFVDDSDEDEIREYLLEIERIKLEKEKSKVAGFGKPLTREVIEKIEANLKKIASKNPPQPVYDLLKYIAEHSPKPLKPWMKDVLTVIRKQARSLAPQGRAKMLNEGWATYWHVRIMRQLFKEKLITPEEHGIFSTYHARVVATNRKHMNPYAAGLALYESVEERWNTGRFGKDYEECEDSYKKANWDTGLRKGREKIFEVRSIYSDRMAVESLFSDEFIHEQQMYIYKEAREGNRIVYRVIEDDPEIIRFLLKNSMLHLPLVITVEDGNCHDRQWLLLKHHYDGTELDHVYRDGTMRYLNYLWGRRVYLETVIGEKTVTVVCEDGNFQIDKRN